MVRRNRMRRVGLRLPLSLLKSHRNTIQPARQMLNMIEGEGRFKVAYLQFNQRPGGGNNEKTPGKQQTDHDSDTAL